MISNFSSKNRKMATSFFYERDSKGYESCTEYVEVKTPQGPQKVNSWHIQGMNTDNVVLPLCQLVHSKLSRKDDLPIYVGNTGYIHLHSDDNLPECWTIDDLGRTVFVFNGYIYFQRYKSGGCVVRKKLDGIGWDAVTKDQEEELITKLG